MKREVKFFVTGEGKVCVEDLSPLEAMVLQQMGVKVKEYGDPIAPATPKRSLLRRVRVRGSLPDDVRSLESLHQDVVTNPEKYTDGDTTEGLSVFELKDYIMKKYLAKCLLCGLLCGGSFARKGRCPMTRPARYHHHFVHLGEEAEIGRTLVIELTGCNMRCKFCQKATSSLLRAGSLSTGMCVESARRVFPEGSWFAFLYPMLSDMSTIV